MHHQRSILSISFVCLRASHDLGRIADEVMNHRCRGLRKCLVSGQHVPGRVIVLAGDEYAAYSHARKLHYHPLRMLACCRNAIACVHA
ncbi:hypothetical protein BV20DRAFT_965636 [Pilatotrama ljubarskyi]|nr:hypothetical protein BV20DRAFT_965636 [Pilatotrama ljubarskyi]